jgi:hypothetical protein
MVACSRPARPVPARYADRRIVLGRAREARRQEAAGVVRRLLQASAAAWLLLAFDVVVGVVTGKPVLFLCAALAASVSALLLLDAVMKSIRGNGRHLHPK